VNGRSVRSDIPGASAGRAGGAAFATVKSIAAVPLLKCVSSASTLIR
jgi:hypothetical protein